MTSFTVTLRPPEGEGRWTHSIQFEWQEASRIVQSQNNRSHTLSWDGSRIEIDDSGDAAWVVQESNGAETRWSLCRVHMNETLTQTMKANPSKCDEDG